MTSSSSSPRLYVESSLAPDAAIAATPTQMHYLLHVLRLKPGNEVRLFNGRDGEWLAHMSAGKKNVSFTPARQTRPQNDAEDIFYLFAPLKHARLDYMAQKATEMGAAKLMPVITQNTQVSRVNEERLLANAIEAAEQCNLLCVPSVDAPQKLDACLANWDADRALIFCDESAAEKSPFETLQSLKNKPCAVLVGPEGGFTKQERDNLLSASFIIPVSLGPRVLRADTAAVAALAMLWQARAA
ncbi:MAG: 16S rRNA (uracil(1498)-N(3))-methyltransferase [Pseudomonadota bacterium]